MKKVTLLFAMFLAFAVVAFAQTDTQGSSSSSSPTSSPSATQGSSSSQGSSTSTGSSSSTMGSQGSSSSSQDTTGTHGSMGQGSTMKGEKAHKVKGCIRSEGGKLVLEDAHGKTFALNSTEDLSAHVGHEVIVHGTEAAGAGAATSTAGAEKEITVSKVDMVSDTCKLEKHGKSSTKGSSTTPPPSSQK